MSSSKLYTKFEELAQRALFRFNGTLEDKVTQWCSEILQHDAEVARRRAQLLLNKIRDWLLQQEDNIHNLLFPSILDVYIEGSKLKIGDSQNGYLEADARTGLALTDFSLKNIPINPTYIDLYKYVPWETLMKIIKSGKLKVSEPSKCNDLYEFMPAWTDEKERNEIFDVIKTLEIVILCLSRTPSSPVMWGHYGDYGKGAVLRFKVPVYRLVVGNNENETMLVIARNEKELHQVLNTQKMLLISDVTYSNTRPEYKGYTNYYEYNQLHSRKGIDWAYEQEVRLIFNNNDFETITCTTDSGKIYLSPCLMEYLREIIVGARREESGKDASEVIKQAIKDSGRKINTRFAISKAEYSKGTYELMIDAPSTPELHTIPLYCRYGLQTHL